MAERAGQTVLTTGANSGIGLATVVEVAEAGFHRSARCDRSAKRERRPSGAREAGVEVETVLLDASPMPSSAE